MRTEGRYTNRTGVVTRRPPPETFLIVVDGDEPDDIAAYMEGIEVTHLPPILAEAEITEGPHMKQTPRFTIKTTVGGIETLTQVDGAVAAVRVLYAELVAGIPAAMFRGETTDPDELVTESEISSWFTPDREDEDSWRT